VSLNVTVVGSISNLIRTSCKFTEPAQTTPNPTPNQGGQRGKGPITPPRSERDSWPHMVVKGLICRCKTEERLGKGADTDEHDGE